MLQESCSPLVVSDFCGIRADTVAMLVTVRHVRGDRLFHGSMERWTILGSLLQIHEMVEQGAAIRFDLLCITHETQPVGFDSRRLLPVLRLKSTNRHLLHLHLLHLHLEHFELLKPAAEVELYDRIIQSMHCTFELAESFLAFAHTGDGECQES